MFKFAVNVAIPLVSVTVSEYSAEIARFVSALIDVLNALSAASARLVSVDIALMCRAVSTASAVLRLLTLLFKVLTVPVKAAKFEVRDATDALSAASARLVSVDIALMRRAVSTSSAVLRLLTLLFKALTVPVKAAKFEVRDATDAV